MPPKRCATSEALLRAYSAKTQHRHESRDAYLAARDALDKYMDHRDGGCTLCQSQSTAGYPLMESAVA